MYMLNYIFRLESVWLAIFPQASDFSSVRYHLVKKSYFMLQHLSHLFSSVYIQSIFSLITFSLIFLDQKVGLGPTIKRPALKNSFQVGPTKLQLFVFTIHALAQTKILGHLSLFTCLYQFTKLLGFGSNKKDFYHQEPTWSGSKYNSQKVM